MVIAPDLSAVVALDGPLVHRGPRTPWRAPRLVALAEVDVDPGAVRERVVVVEVLADDVSQGSGATIRRGVDPHCSRGSTRAERSARPTTQFALNEVFQPPHRFLARTPVPRGGPRRPPWATRRALAVRPHDQSRRGQPGGLSEPRAGLGGVPRGDQGRPTSRLLPRLARARFQRNNNDDDDAFMHGVAPPGIPSDRHRDGPFPQTDQVS